MASVPLNIPEIERQQESGSNGRFIRVIVADSQSIFRAGLRKVFAVEDDIRVVGQAETLAQTLAAAQRFSADLLILEAGLAANPIRAAADLLRQTPGLHLLMVVGEASEELTLELFRHGVHGIVSRDVEPEFLVDCVRKVSKGEPWLDARGIQWVLEAYRTQDTRPLTGRSKVQLTPKESLIVGCVTQGMKNREIAHRVGTTEQVVKNYLRKVYDKLGVADRLELALYCLHNRIVDLPSPNAAASNPPAIPATSAAVTSTNEGSAMAAVAGGGDHSGKIS
jgi:DNA-binding NarL/FixJ family response regulator